MENEISELETLQKENAELKADFKEVIQIFLKLSKIIGAVNEDGTINDKIKVKHIMSEVGNILTKSMFGGGDELKEQFGFIAQIAPIYEKYKNL